MNSIILRTTSRFLVPLLLLFSIFVLLRGHNDPGGGFIGGLLAAGAFTLLALSHGPATSRRLLRADPRSILATGLLLAVASGIPAMVLSRPFLTGLWMSQPIPGVGKVGTVLLFDVGVYLVVLGTTLLIVLTLDEER